MELTSSFLKVDEQSISLNKAIKFLQTSGQLNSFVSEIIRQYVLEQELQKQTVSSKIIEQIINQLRSAQQLLNQKKFEQWLAQQEIDEATFVKRITDGVKLQQLMAEVIEPKLQEYFIDRKVVLDKVVLSRLVVETEDLAEELKTQVVEEDVRFEQLVQEYSLTEDSIYNGMMGAISRGSLPDKVRMMIDTATVGELVGPIELAGNWCLFRLEKVLPASLANEELKQTLRQEIFEKWLQEKMQRMEIELQLSS